MAQAINGLSVINKAMTDITKSLPKSIKVDGKEIKSTALITSSAKANLFLTLKKTSDKGMCIESAKIPFKEVKQYGFKSTAEYLVKAFTLDITMGQANDYIRVGKIFGKLDGTGYHWKKPIPDSVTMTNLRQIMPLVFEDCKDKESKDVNKLSDTDLNKLFDKFVSKYIDLKAYTDPSQYLVKWLSENTIPLQASNATLREWLKGLADAKRVIMVNGQIVDDNGTENGTGNGTENGTGNDNDPKTVNPIVTIVENARIALTDLMCKLADNEDIEKKCLDLLDLINALDISTEDSESEDSESEDSESEDSESEDSEPEDSESEDSEFEE